MISHPKWYVHFFRTVINPPYKAADIHDYLLSHFRFVLLYSDSNESKIFHSQILQWQPVDGLLDCITYYTLITPMRACIPYPSFVKIFIFLNYYLWLFIFDEGVERSTRYNSLLLRTIWWIEPDLASFIWFFTFLNRFQRK